MREFAARQARAAWRPVSAVPLVSIVTPTYNHQAYIRQCIQSVIAQTDFRWEQIVMDDGSTDGTGDVVLGIDDPRVRYVRQEHRGIGRLGETYNDALKLARGTLVAVLEGDDFWPSDKLERQLPAFRDEQVVLSWGKAGETDPSGAVRELFPSSSVVAKLQQSSPAEALHYLLEGNYIPASTVICRRSALERIGGFWQPSGIPTTDYPTWLKLCCLGTFMPLDNVLGYWRRHGTQVTAQLDVEMRRVPAFDWAAVVAGQLSNTEQRTLRLSPSIGRRIDDRRRARMDLSAGRTALRERRRDTAKALFRSAARGGGTRTRTKALFGLTCATIGVDLEFFVRLRDRIRGSAESVPPGAAGR